MKRFSLTFLLIFSIHSLVAQIVNTERMRLQTNKNGWVGDIDASLGWTRNKAGQTLRFGANLRAEYLLDKSRWMILGGYNLTQFKRPDNPDVPDRFTNKGFSHLRYNRKISKKLTWEAFSQLQYDDVQDIELRFLAGTGPRFRLVENDSCTFYWGILPMYEYEESSEDPNDEEIITLYRDLRLSTYLSTSFRIRKSITLNHVTYFQPVMYRWSDFRISSETRLNIALGKDVSLNTFFQLVYDSSPAMAVPPLMYSLTNGLSISM